LFSIQIQTTCVYAGRPPSPQGWAGVGRLAVAGLDGDCPVAVEVAGLELGEALAEAAGEGGRVDPTG
jgi:hypothetical protein